MANPNFARTKHGQAQLRKINDTNKFCVDYTKQARDASPDALSKLSSMHSEMSELGKKASEADRMQYTGVSAFTQGKNSGKFPGREMNIEANMEQAHVRFALGVEKARNWEYEKDYEQEIHRLAGIKRQ